MYTYRSLATDSLPGETLEKAMAPWAPPFLAEPVKGEIVEVGRDHLTAPIKPVSDLGKGACTLWEINVHVDRHSADGMGSAIEAGDGCVLKKPVSDAAVVEFTPSTGSELGNSPAAAA